MRDFTEANTSMVSLIDASGPYYIQALNGKDMELKLRLIFWLCVETLVV